MARQSYSREDVQTHSDGFRPGRPAVNVKVYAAAVVKTPLTAIAAEFETATGNKVTLVFDTAGATEQKFRADADAA